MKFLHYKISPASHSIMTRLIDKDRVLPDEMDKLQAHNYFFYSNEPSLLLTHVILMWELFYLLLEYIKIKARRDNRQTPFRVIKGIPRAGT